MHPLLAAAFARLQDAQVRWCLLRGRDRLAAPGGDVDLLVAPADAEAATAALIAAGFARRRIWAQGSQRFLVGYDEETGTWINLHVVTAVAFGAPLYGLELPVVDAVLRRAVDVAGVPMPAPADAFWLVLLHALLDKGELRDAHAAALAAVAAEAGMHGPVPEALAARGLGVEALVRTWQAGDVAALVAAGAALRREWERQADARRRARRHGRSLTRRKLAEALRPIGVGVALLAPDGAGKSTLASGLADAFHVPTRLHYLGLEGGVFAGSGRSRVPGAGLLLRLAHMWRTWLRARVERGRRAIVVYDRYPYDARLAPRTPVSVPGRVRRALLGHSLPAPDLVVVLDAPAEVLHARKAEHSLEVLAADRQRYLDLAARLPGAVVVVDAARPADEVRRAVVSAVWERYRERCA